MGRKLTRYGGSPGEVNKALKLCISMAV